MTPDDFKARFKITCLKCGSENVEIDFDGGEQGSECSDGMITGGYSATITLGCQDCKQNDAQFYPF